MKFLTPVIEEMISLSDSLILLSLLSLFFIIKKLTSTKRPPLPPGPYPWPIVGNIFQIGNSPHIRLAELARVYGPLMSVQVGNRILVVGSSPTAALNILKTHDNFLSGRSVTRPLRFKGSKFHNLALVFSDECDDSWRAIRNAYRKELFSAQAMEFQVETREKKVMELVKYFGSKQGQPIMIKDTVFGTVLNTLSNAFLSVDVVDLDGNGVGGRMMGSIRRLTEVAGTQQLSDLYPVLAGWDSKSVYNKVLGVAGEIWDVWFDILKEKRNNGGHNHLSDATDFADALIREGFTDEQINPMILELYTGGTETISSTVEWMIAELLKQQEAMQKLQDELAREINGEIVRESDLPRLPYLEACVKEVLRLHPVAPLLLPHQAVQTCEVMGYTVPKDSIVMVNLWALGRDPEVWHDPLSFKPERFLESAFSYLPGKDFNYLPFGSGRRMCPGIAMATKMVPLIVASLIHNMDWSFPNNMTPSDIGMEDALYLGMHKREPLCVVPKLRAHLKV